jgi:hypothetical protein
MRHVRFTPVIVLCLLAALASATRAASREPVREADIRRPLAVVEERRQKALTALRKRFGNDLQKKCPPHILEELKQFEKQRDALEPLARRLRANVSQLDSDTSSHRFKEIALESAKRALDARGETLRARDTALAGRIKRHNQKVIAHDAELAKVNGRAAYDKWKREKEELNAKGRALAVEKRKLLKEAHAHDTDEKRLQTRETLLRNAKFTLGRRREGLRITLVEFTRDCERVSLRALTLAEVAAVASAGGGSAAAGQSNLVDAAKIIGPSVLKQMAWRGASGYAGLVLTAEDIAEAGINERDREIRRRILLVGDCAAALRELKRRGRLKPGDPGYEAVRRTLARIQGEMPSSQGEFTLQSLGSLKTLARSVTAIAGQYTGGLVEKPGRLGLAKIWKGDRKLYKMMGKGFRRMMKVEQDVLSNVANSQIIDRASELARQQREGLRRPAGRR